MFKSHGIVRTVWKGWQGPRGLFSSRSHSKNPHGNSALGSESAIQVDVWCQVHGTFSGRLTCSDGPASLPESGTVLKGHFRLSTSLLTPEGLAYNHAVHPCRRQATGAPQRVCPRESYRNRALLRVCLLRSPASHRIYPKEVLRPLSMTRSFLSKIGVVPAKKNRNELGKNSVQTRPTN